MSRQALVLDVDGVLVTGHKDKGGWWHVDMEADLGLDPDLFQRAFFTEQWGDIVCGNQDIEAPLAKTLADIAPHLHVEELLDYWFRTDARLVEDLLSTVEKLKQRDGLTLHLATNQEHRRARYLMNELGLGTVFDAIHYSAEIGHAKPDAIFFRTIEERTGLPPEAHLFFDDQEKNVEAARACGWRAEVWTGVESCELLSKF